MKSSSADTAGSLAVDRVSDGWDARRTRLSSLHAFLVAATVTIVAGAFAAPTGAAPIVGRLVVTNAYLYDCVDSCSSGPAGFYELWVAGPSLHFQRFAPQARFFTPTHPSFSPDSRWLLYATHAGQLAVQSVLHGRLVGRRHTLPIGAEGLTASWAPDSAHLVLAGHVRGKNGLWVVRRDGSRPRQIVCDCSVIASGNIDDDEVPSWSPAGLIAFVGFPAKHPENVFAGAIYVVHPDGSALHALTAPVPVPLDSGGAYVEDTAPRWSPDGARFVYSHDTDADLRIHSGHGAVERRLGHKGQPATWSPDGRFIAYIDDNNTVQVVKVQGGPNKTVHTPEMPGFLADLDWRRSIG